MRIVFFGTPEIAKEALEFLFQNGVEIVGIVTKPDKPKGRSSTLLPPPVKEWAQKAIPSVPLFQPEKASTSEMIEALKQLHPDLFVVVAYGEIMKQALLDVAPHGAINLHASLLPKWRGAAPIQRAIEAGDQETGVSIIRLVQKMDAGPILLKRSIPLDDIMRSSELFQALSIVGKEVLLEVIHQLDKGQAVEEIQDESQVTHAAKLTPEGCQINWHVEGKKLHNMVRAAYPNPIAWTEALIRGEKKKLNILESRFREDVELPPAEIYLSKKEIMVGTGKGALQLLQVQQEGKKAMNAMDWARGLQDIEFVL